VTTPATSTAEASRVFRTMDFLFRFETVTALRGFNKLRRAELVCGHLKVRTGKEFALPLPCARAMDAVAFPVFAPCGAA
jgi:hypothetical protein